MWVIKKNIQFPGLHSRSSEPESPGALGICVFKKSAATIPLLAPTHIWWCGLDFRHRWVDLGQPYWSLQHQPQGYGSGFKGCWGFEYLPWCWEVRPLSPVSPEQFCPSCACDTVCLLVLVCLQRIPRLPGAGHGPGLGEHALLHAGVPVHGHVQRHDPKGVFGGFQASETHRLRESSDNVIFQMEKQSGMQKGVAQGAGHCSFSWKSLSPLAFGQL